MTCSQKTLSIWQLFYLNKAVLWFFIEKIQGFFLQKLYDSHLNFHGKEYYLCTEQYMTQSAEGARIISWQKGGPKATEIQVRHSPNL